MDDIEDYTVVFFQECDELLDDLEERLGALIGGSGDPEVINAAFRAVHSIKGGADAFGYRELVAFAHIFEATMDAIRGGRLDASPEVCELLIRGRDVLCELVERARDGDISPLPAAAVMIEEFAALSDGGKGAGDAPQANAEQPAAEPTPEPTPEASGATATPEKLFDDMAEDLTYHIHFAPGPDFQTSGHDPLRLIQALRGLGAVKAVVEGEIPPLADLDPDICPLAWEITLETESDLAEIESFFAIYRSTSEVEITLDEAEVEPMAVAGAAPPPANDKAAIVPLAVTNPIGTEPAGATAGIAPKKPSPDAEPAAATPNKAGRTLRVDLERVDRLVNMVGEIVITQAAMAQTLVDQETSNLELGHDIDAMSRQIRELQESVMAIRAQPVKAVFSRMARLVRDLAQQLGKEVRAEILGEHTEIDTTVIEELAEPLIHMIRNAMDHGIEGPEDRVKAGKPRHGTVLIAAEHRGERVVIRISDDGRGINRERVLAKAIERGVVEPGTVPTPEEIDQFVFHPGLSTTEAVSNVSGRGVGMDVVKRNISALGGRVHLDNRPGNGTTITITLPLSLAVLDGMTIAVGDQRFVIPLGAVVEAMTLADAAPRSLPSGAQVMVRRDEYLPLLSVRNALGIAGSQDSEQLVVIVDADADARMGLLVDELIGQRQVVLKSLDANYRSVPGVSGATILSDGLAALILDVPALRLLALAGTRSSKFEYCKLEASKMEYIQ
jgi:two-component system chemotaxis sensor kinase CheA